MTSRALVCALFAASTLFACAGPSPTRPTTVTPPPPVAPPPPTPGPGSVIHGVYQGILTFTDGPRFGWPSPMTITASLEQNGADVRGDFDLKEVMYSGGYVTGTVASGATTDAVGTFKASFLPDDLGVPFDVDTTITAQDGGAFTGTFVFAAKVGRGNATFTRLK